MKKLKILFFDNSVKLKTINDLETGGRGGMVSSLFTISDYLSNCGHRVYVLGSIEENGKTKAGTVWIGKGATIHHEEDFDFLIHNRGTDDGIPEVRAKHRILWTHDLPHNGHIPEPMTIRAFAATVFMSEYAEDVWRAFYPQIGRSFLIPNGVDKNLFYPRDNDRKYLIFASAPNRGLKRLPLIYEALRSRVSSDLCMRAFSNMAVLHPNEVRDEETDGFSVAYKSCKEAGIDLRDPVPQAQLAEELGNAGLMILPTDYPEICSNTVLQSLASGTPIVTTGNLGSAGEWIKNGANGTLTKYHPVDYMIHTVELVRSAVKILSNKRLHEQMMVTAARTKIHTWEEIGSKWEKMLKKLS